MDLQQHKRPLQLLRRPQVEARVGLSRSTIYQLMSSGQFPRPIPIGQRAVGWPSDQIDAWIRSRIADAVRVVRCDLSRRACNLCNLQQMRKKGAQVK